MTPLGIFGALPFMCSSETILTFSDLKIAHSARYGVHQVLGAAPVPEYIGPDQRKVTFKIQLRADFGSPPMVYVEILRTMLESGESFPLCFGPDYMGRFYLRSFSEDRKYFTGAGVPLATDVQITAEEDRGFSVLSTAVSALKRLFR